MPLGIQLFIALVVGGVLGFLFGWLIGRARGAVVPDARLENELRQQVAQREAELTQLRGQLTETGNARAAAEAGTGRGGKNGWWSSARCRTRRWPICARRSRP